MAKTLTGSILSPSTTLYPGATLYPKGASYFENSQILYLFEFEFISLDGLTTEIVRFTDNDLFINEGGNTYTPINISFNDISEDSTLQADNVEILVDNIDSEITNKSLEYEWRNNTGKIYRIVYNELPQSSNGDTYEQGIFSFDNNYPSIDFDKTEYSNIYFKDLIFEGLMDDLKGGSGSATITLTSELSMWDSNYPNKTFDQGQFGDIISVMTTELGWGQAL